MEYHHKGQPIPRNAFVLTFDDGYECVYTNAWPILKELQIPATIFVITGLLDTNAPMPCEDWPAAGSHLVPSFCLATHYNKTVSGYFGRWTSGIGHAYSLA